MIPLEDIYKDSFFRTRHKLLWRVPIICDAIVAEFKPNSVVDVGCALGEYVMGFRGLGVPFCYGIEGSERCLPHIVVSHKYIRIKDLRKEIEGLSLFDLAMSFEVAEHIEPEFTDQYLDNLIRLSDRILLTAAPPGQKGHYHVNCQPKEYWIDKFNNLGYINIQERAERIKEEWTPWLHRKEIKGYYNNLLYFERR